MGLSTAGIGSNLPIEDIISQLMAVERRPLNILDKKVSSYKAKLSAIGNLKNAMEIFQSAARTLSSTSKFQAVSATPSDTTIATASATSGATLGNYSLEVKQLAAAQKLAAAGQASATTAIGAGTITFDFGTIDDTSATLANGKYSGATFTSGGAGTRSVTIGTDTSLTGIRDAINKADIGVTASIVNDGSGATPYRLVLSAQDTGKAHSMKIGVSGDAALQALLSHDPENASGQALEQTASAKDATIVLDGLEISHATNAVTNVIDGVTLNLAKTNIGSSIGIAIERDEKTVTESVDKFVAAYNAVSKTLKDLSAYNESTKTAAALNGDSTVRGIQGQLRSILNTPVGAGGGTALSVLSDIGVTIKNGVMEVDKSKLSDVIDTKFDEIASLFAAVGKPTSSLASYKTSTSATQAGTYAVVVNKVATQGYTTGSSAAGLIIDATNKTLQVTLDGVSAAVTLSEGTYASASALATEVQSKINGATAFSDVSARVTVTESGGVLTLTSDAIGATSSVSLAADAGGTSLLGASATTLAGVNAEGTIDGVAAVGSGKTLTAAAGTAAEGLALTVAGTGSLSVNYTQGYAWQFDQYVTSLLDTDSGALALRSDGLNDTIDSLDDSRERLLTRLALTEKRFRAQYVALDKMIGSMNSTASYLMQQLSRLD